MDLPILTARTSMSSMLPARSCLRAIPRGPSLMKMVIKSVARDGNCFARPKLTLFVTSPGPWKKPQICHQVSGFQIGVKVERTRVTLPVETFSTWHIRCALRNFFLAAKCVNGDSIRRKCDQISRNGRCQLWGLECDLKTLTLKPSP